MYRNITKPILENELLFHVIDRWCSDVEDIPIGLKDGDLEGSLIGVSGKAIQKIVS